MFFKVAIIVLCQPYSYRAKQSKSAQQTIIYIGINLCKVLMLFSATSPVFLPQSMVNVSSKEVFLFYGPILKILKMQNCENKQLH